MRARPHARRGRPFTDSRSAGSSAGLRLPRGVLDASFGPGSPMSDDTCDRTEPDLFTLRSSAGGIQLRPQGSDLCVGVKGEPAVRAPVLQLPCDERAPGQLFTIADR
ncbi:hypothetical protein GCM10023088_30970 [Actinomadura verrucosospora]|uniref:RICIN domain-containing protein n=2 Tax=Actinomadura verrucosospora TaxID=46165 RepID=UPI0031E991EB